MRNDVEVTTSDLHYAYGRRQALRGVDLRLTPGVVGLLGPNGAGKSTLINVLATLSRPGSGQVRVGDADLSTAAGRRAARRLIGHLPQRFDVIGGMTLRRHAEYSAWTHGLPSSECAGAAERALDEVELGELADRKARSVSGGQRQRLGIACAIVHRPALLLLDEPTVGLDPAQRVRVRHYLHQIGTTTTVLISTHLVEDVAQIADGLLVLLDGRVAYRGTVADLASAPAPAGPGLHMSALELGYQGLVAATEGLDR